MVFLGERSVPAGITLSTTTSSTAAENTGTSTFTVILDSEPTSNVVLTVSSDNTAEGTVSPETLTFTTANYNTPQTVTVTGVDDNLVQDDSAIITVAVDDALSADEYDSVSDQTHTTSFSDDDTAGFTLSATTSTAAENTGTSTFTVILDSEPTSNVVLTVSSDNTAEGTVSPETLTFTTANYNTPQTVTVTGGRRQPGTRRLSNHHRSSR